MKLLRCKLCKGEMEMLDNERSINRKAYCLDCGYPNIEAVKKEPEVMVIRKRLIMSEDQ